MTPRLEFICVGTELLTGKVSSHPAYLGQKLSAIGLSITREHTVGDDPGIMRETFAEVFKRSKVVISAGGLGPTFDDITRGVWSKVLKAPLRFRPQLLSEIREKFKSRGLRMPPMNRRQAMVLKGAEVISNPNGTAPGQYWKRGGKIVALLPGPAREIYPMFDQFLLPRLQNIFSNSYFFQKTFLMFGVPESRVDEIIRPWVCRYKTMDGCSITHGILASQSIISVKFTVKGTKAAKVADAAKKLTHDLRRLIGGLTFGEDDDTMEGVIGQLLTTKRQTLAVAESCTGGLISKLITDQPGASEFFVEGITSYHNRSKSLRLSVRGSTLKRHGAVSKQTAREMAEGLLRSSRVDHALSVTGIAGPTGGSAAKPVGLVYIGYAGPRRTIVKEFRFTGERAWIRHRASLMALDLLRKELLHS